MNTESTIYSIGHGRKSVEKFIDELNSFNIRYLLDIRSMPYSKWSPQFNKRELEQSLKNKSIEYAFFGDVLGGLPDKEKYPECYDRDGKVDYDKIKDMDFFKKGLERLERANEKKINIAIMCSESKPEECHRSKLIGREMLKNHISINHIVSISKAKSQSTVMNELNKGLNTKNLFGEEINFTSRKTY